MAEKNEIAALFASVRDLSAQADDLGLREVRPILDYACDRLVFAYHQTISSAEVEACARLESRSLVFSYGRLA